jgi:hypothetical protein
MPAKFALKPSVQLGVVPTHLKFVGGLVPDENGKFPRDADGALRIVSGMKSLCDLSPVKMSIVQIPFFASADAAEFAEMIAGLKALDLEVHYIIMVGCANPMNPADEDAVVAQLVTSIKSAISHGVRHVSSTSIEEWMNATEVRRDGAEFEAAISQNVKVHMRAYQEAGVEGSCIENWHIEFLRPGEFKTFTNVDRAWQFVSAANQALGKKFFKLLVDASHCGDSGLSIAENQTLIARIAAAGEFGVFHASAKTTRGCLSTDDGWISALLTAAANGDIVSVSAMTETFIKERVHTATGEKHPVTIDDACAFIARFENGSLAIFESTRYARGHKALYTFEINGEKKSLAWDLHDLNYLYYFDHGVPCDRRGWTNIHATDGDHPYSGNWWVPGLCLSYEHSFTHALAEFFKSLEQPSADKRYPDFRHALGTQYVYDAVLESAKTKQWVDVKKS